MVGLLSLTSPCRSAIIPSSVVGRIPLIIQCSLGFISSFSSLLSVRSPRTSSSRIGQPHNLRVSTPLSRSASALSVIVTVKSYFLRERPRSGIPACFWHPSLLRRRHARSAEGMGIRCIGSLAFSVSFLCIKVFGQFVNCC